MVIFIEEWCADVEPASRAILKLVVGGLIGPKLPSPASK